MQTTIDCIGLGGGHDKGCFHVPSRHYSSRRAGRNSGAGGELGIKPASAIIFARTCFLLPTRACSCMGSFKQQLPRAKLGTTLLTASSWQCLPVQIDLLEHDKSGQVIDGDKCEVIELAHASAWPARGSRALQHLPPASLGREGTTRWGRFSCNFHKLWRFSRLEVGGFGRELLARAVQRSLCAVFRPGGGADAYEGLYLASRRQSGVQMPDR